MRNPPRSFGARLRLAARRPSFGRARALAHDESGATAVEFALLLVPFLILFFGLFELGFVYFATLTLDEAVTGSGRQIRTGEVQTTGGTAATFKTAVCKNMGLLTDMCPSALRIDVRTVSTFASTTSLTTPTNTCWDPGGPASLVVVRAYFDWPLIVPLLSQALETANGKRTLTSATAFVNEPYNNTTASAVTCP
ncbi:TadE/TadG family type IV pilus assembly protein [Caulobacter hibisci]|uniref:Pilus assembly protein n=1 Tax=Caulobacter hibisci TaxID=2035993 RepID=A0ABS0T2A0_9CAUL|nr:TadE/TadG family type IV pilus assembly protein [Caulobacter hibisci]MBI1686012.1 pilus assembly protein [Caulobacter hibisci]